jgi:hypothetical protein
MTPHELTLARRAAVAYLPPSPAPSRQQKGRKLPRNVYPHGSRYRAQLSRHGQLINIGTYRTPGEAADAVTRWKGQQHSS